jgi:hypothetical protein
VASLRELQDSFAAALRDPATTCAVLPPANIAVYRNNASFTFRETLERSFPVVRRRVGDDYFRQLAALYHARFPSRSGDLHWFGREFPGFLDDYLQGEYAWLADLARLERLREESTIEAVLPAVGVEALADLDASALEQLRFGLQPSLRLYSSSYPVFSVWQANQVDNAPPMDQSIGSEAGMVLCRDNGIEVRELPARLFSFLFALHRGATLSDAMTLAAFDEHELTNALTFVFREGLATSIA